jgi:hypothetical protein
LTLGLVGGKWSASHPILFTALERAPGTDWIGGWLGPRASLDDLEKRRKILDPTGTQTPTFLKQFLIKITIDSYSGESESKFIVVILKDFIDH